MAKFRLSAVSLVALILQTAAPAVFAAGGCALSALDTVAGLGTEVSLKGCIPNASLQLTVRHTVGQDYTQTIATDLNGDATTLVPSKYTVTAGKYDVYAGSETTSFTVLADRVDDAHSSLLTSADSIRSNGQDTVTVTVILRDRFDNPVSGRPIALIASRLSDEVTTQSKQTDDEGRFLWTVRSTEPGLITLIPYDILSGRQLKLRADVTAVQGGSNSWLRGNLTGQESGNDPVSGNLSPSGNNSDLSSALIDHFELGLPQGATEVNVNDLFSMNIRAMRGTDTVRAYVGTLIVTSSDPDAQLPKKGDDPKSPTTGRIDIRDIDQGQRNLALAFVLRKEGTQTIEVADKDVPSITGKITLTVKRAGGPSTDTIVILAPKDRSRVKGSDILLQGKAPSLINLIVKGGKDPVTGESDSEGVFRIPVVLNPEDKEVTLFVTSENNSYESEPVHIIVDNDPPKIESMTMDPPAGKTGKPGTLIMKSEPGLGSAVASFEGKDFPLTGSGGIYTATLNAPDKEGTYDITVTATDSVGNSSSMLMKWDVKPAAVPVVQGVTAEGQPLQVAIKWQPVDSFPVSEYRIYVAKDSDPTNYLYSVSTKKPAASATIKDLPLGVTYQFSVTALSSDGLESPEKSQPAVSAPQGMTLTAKPGTDSVLLEWTKIPSLPMDHYDLKYGTDPNNYTETRSVDGQAVSYIVHDLIGETTYEFKLTPVTVTGKTMDELSATVRVTDGSAEFVPGTYEPVPTDILGHPGAPVQPETPVVTPPPSTPSSGFPSFIIWSILAVTGLLALLQWRRIRFERRLTREFFELMGQRYHS
jgi:hypothetical protein